MARKSPLTKYANATLVFQVPTGQLAVDAHTGNQMPATQTVTIKAWLKPATSAGMAGYPTGVNFPGADEGSERLTGRCVLPLDLPLGIGHLSKGTCTITNPTTGRKQTGTFVLYRGTASPFNVENKMGALIHGEFTTQLLPGA